MSAEPHSMKSKRLGIFSISAVVIMFLAGLLHGRTYLTMPGATQDENRELSEMLNVHGRSQERRLKAYDLLLRKSPGNRPARFLHAELLIRVGRIEQAKSELEYLRAKSPEFPGVYETEARLWHVLGNKKMELEACERILKRKYKDTLAAQLAKGTALSTQGRVAELKGQPGKAETILKGQVSDSHPKMVWFYLSRLADFHLRQGNRAKAIEFFESAVESGRKHKASGNSQANLGTRFSIALWAAKKRHDALEIALRSAKVHLSSSSRTSHELLAKAVLTGHVLTQGLKDSEPQKKKARLLLEKASKRFPVGSPYSITSVVLVLTGKLPRDEAIDRVKKVLKAAPHLDWALWAALYLGLSEPEHAKDLLKLLPEESLQRRIAEIEQKAAAAGA